jgi:hypothetical protein
MCLPGIEEAKLISVADGGLSIVVVSSTSFHRVPIYQRYHWEFMDRESPEGALRLILAQIISDRAFVVSGNFVLSSFHEEESQHSLSTAVSPLLGEVASPSESLPSFPNWRDYSAKFRLPYSSMVSYKSYNEATSETRYWGRGSELIPDLLIGI